jgi:hypothetical protein
MAKGQPHLSPDLSALLFCCKFSKIKNNYFFEGFVLKIEILTADLKIVVTTFTEFLHTLIPLQFTGTFWKKFTYLLLIQYQIV